MKRCGIGRRGACGGGPLDPLEKHAGLHVAVLVSMEDVAAAFEDPTGDARDEAGLIRPVQ